MKSPIVIIGSGLGGYMLAKEFRKIDKSTPLTIITQNNGDFYSKPLLSTALTQQKTAEQLIIKNAEEMAEELSATVITHTPVKRVHPEEKVIILDHQKISFSSLIFACGAQTIQPLLNGNAVPEICSVNDLNAYQHFRHWLNNKKHITILGAGLVGCEFANDLINTEYKITIIAPESHPLSQLVPQPIAQVLEQVFAEHGVIWKLGHLATEINHNNGMGYEVHLSNNEKIITDGVFSAIGLRPSCSLAKSANIHINRGIIVNRWLQTNFPHIFALGDCAEVDGLVKFYVAPLLECARALAKILTGGTEPVIYPPMPISIKTSVFPIVTSPPGEVIGEWQIEGSGTHLRALFYDHNGQLHGFCLTGDKIREKMQLAKQLPSIFN